MAFCWCAPSQSAVNIFYITGERCFDVSGRDLVLDLSLSWTVINFSYGWVIVSLHYSILDVRVVYLIHRCVCVCVCVCFPFSSPQYWLLCLGLISLIRRWVLCVSDSVLQRKCLKLDLINSVQDWVCLTFLEQILYRVKPHNRRYLF